MPFELPANHQSMSGKPQLTYCSSLSRTSLWRLLDFSGCRRIRSKNNDCVSTKDRKLHSMHYGNVQQAASSALLQVQSEPQIVLFETSCPCPPSRVFSLRPNNSPARIHRWLPQYRHPEPLVLNSIQDLDSGSVLMYRYIDTNQVFQLHLCHLGGGYRRWRRSLNWNLSIFEQSRWPFYLNQVNCRW